MKRVLSFLLALSPTAGTIQAAFAEGRPGDYRDSAQVLTTPPSKESEQTQFLTVRIDELLARPTVTPFCPHQQLL